MFRTDEHLIDLLIRQITTTETECDGKSVNIPSSILE